MGYARDGLLCGFKLYDAQGNVLLKTGFDWVKHGCSTHTELLEEGERILGYKSRIFV